jgi:3-phenylpropionate/cinnamic acid dioxygenase small subunit
MLETDDPERTVASACTQFLLDEAVLLDTRRLQEWTALFAEDAVYWLPMDPGQVAPGDGLNIVYDDRPRLLDRVSRLNSGLAFSDEPHSATSHTLSPVRLLDGQRAREAAGGHSLLIVMERIDLLNAQDPLPVLTFLL